MQWVLDELEMVMPGTSLDARLLDVGSTLVLRHSILSGFDLGILGVPAYQKLTTSNKTMPLHQVVLAPGNT